MLAPEAVIRFTDAQKRLLRQTYDQAWREGAGSYEPNQPRQEPSVPRDMALVGLTGAALLAARRLYRYVPPTAPDAMRRAIALAPAFRGLNQMAAELASLAASGAVGQWTADNGWRLDAGASAAWAGEQAGFAEAADAAGQALYQWVSVGDNRTCPDCELLSGFPPMALTDWPTSPGAADTACNAGCRCSWDTFDAPLPADYRPDLSPDQLDLVSTINDRQLQALSDVVGDAPYLA